MSYEAMKALRATQSLYRSVAEKHERLRALERANEELQARVARLERLAGVEGGLDPR